MKQTLLLVVAAIAAIGAYGQVSDLEPNRIMLFNDYPPPFLRPKMNPQQSFYSTNWVHDGPAPGGLGAAKLQREPLLSGTNHIFKVVSDVGTPDQWVIKMARTGSAHNMPNARSIGPVAGYSATITTNWAGLFQNSSAGVIESPYYHWGIGTLYFDALNTFAEFPDTLIVEIATNMFNFADAYYTYVTNDITQEVTTNTHYATTNMLLQTETAQFSNKWESLSEILVDRPDGTPYRFQYTLNHRQPARFRIKRKGEYAAVVADNCFIEVDNIRVPRPPSDVAMKHPELFCEPGYPSFDSTIRMRCEATNVGTNAYEKTYAGGDVFSVRSLKCFYRWRYLNQASNGWSTVDMVYEANSGDGNGNGEIWQTNIPAQSRVGDLEYYFTSTFAGYRYIPLDYTRLGHTYWTNVVGNSESLSPRSYRGDTSQPDGREFHIRLRPFPSDFENLYVVTGPPWVEENPFPMTLVSNDVWRAMLPINGTMTNLHFYFRGDRKYNADDKSISATPFYWSESAQAMQGVVPFGGQCAVMATRPIDKPIKITAESGGFVQVLFDLNTLKYMTTRAEYQDFNNWGAPTDHFTDSNGQASKERFFNTFNAWPANGSIENRDFFKEFFIGYPSFTNEYQHAPFPTLNGWQAGTASFVVERVTADADNKPDGIGPLYRNNSLRLKGGAGGLGLGYVHNTRNTLSDGIDRLSFKARVAQRSLPDEVVFYRYGFTNQNYMITASIRAVDTMSPETPSISLIGYYIDPSNFYELRFTQDVDITVADPKRDQRVLVELYKWRDGTPYLLSSKVPSVNLVLSGGIKVEMRIFTSGNSTIIKCKAASTDNIISTPDGGGIGGPAIRDGTCGFLSGECRAVISDVSIRPTTTDATATGTAVDILTNEDIANMLDPYAAASLKKWYLSAAGRWKMEMIATPYGIHSIPPTQKLGIYVQPTKHGTTSLLEPQAPGTTAWQLYKEINVSGFGYSNYQIDFKEWRSHFVMLQIIGRDDQQVVDIGIDELEISSWRGQDSSDLGPGESDSSNQIRNDEWAATESWIVDTWVPGLNEGRVPGAFNTTQRSPMTATHLSPRLVNVYEGWITNSTYVYNGQMYCAVSNMQFAANFNGKLRLRIGSTDVLDADGSSVTALTNSITFDSSGWYNYELRLGFGADGVGGPLNPNQLNGWGIAFSTDNGATWRNMIDNGNMSLLRARNTVVRQDLTQEGRSVTGDQPPYAVGDWLEQSLRGPLLERGVGLMEFDYRVLKAPAKISVQFAPDWDSTTWTTVRSWVVSNAMSTFSHELAYLGTNSAGYLRVHNDRSSGYTNAIVEFNNATVWDEPEIDDQSWRAYNIKVTNTDEMRIMMDGEKAAFLNNTQTGETDPAQLQYPESHIVSPMLPTGIGSLTFMARVYDPGVAGALNLYVTSSEAGPRAQPSEWEQVKTYTVTNHFFETIDYKPEDGRDYRAFKLSIPTVGGSSRRVGVENIAVVEPVLPGFEIAATIPMCVDGNEYNIERQQPLHNDIVGFQAQVSNIRENPLDIKMFVSYYVGTNHWGIGNWPEGETFTLEMGLYDHESLAYRTGHPSPAHPLTDSVPVQEKNSVVQYYVWATYKDERGVVFTNKQRRATFENPSWYFPTDLNAKFGDINHWSPYYIVYDIPVGAVWINEINAEDSVLDGPPHIGENKYIEIAVPAGYDLAGWRVDLVQNNRSVIPITLPEGMLPQENYTNGYAFFVIGENEINQPYNVPPLPKQDFPNGGYLGLNSWLPQTSPGGIRLRRPLGIYEHVVAYDWQPSWAGFNGQAWADDDPEGRFEYIGSEIRDGSLSVVTNSLLYAVPQVADWREKWEWTPGAPNVGQVVPDANLMAPGVSNVVVSSTLNMLRGTQNGQRLTPLTFRIKIGSATNILFEADEWYRFASITLDGLELLSGEVTNYDLHLSNIQSNTSIYAHIALRGDVDNLDLPGDVLNWLKSFGDEPLAPTWYGTNPYQPLSDRRELSILERFWINANPTRTNYLQGGVVGLLQEPVTSNFFVTIALDLNGSNITQLLGDGNIRDGVLKIEARQPPAIQEWQFMKQFKFDANSFSNRHSTAYIFNPYRNLIPEADPTRPIALRWVIEYVHPLFSTTLLQSTNAPALP